MEAFAAAPPEASTTDSEASTTDSEGPVLVDVVQILFLPRCRCDPQNLRTLMWIPNEREARCFECLNRVDVPRLSPSHRFAYMLLRLLWAHQDYQPTGCSYLLWT